MNIPIGVIQSWQWAGVRPSTCRSCDESSSADPCSSPVPATYARVRGVEGWCNGRPADRLPSPEPGPRELRDMPGRRNPGVYRCTITSASACFGWRRRRTSTSSDSIRGRSTTRPCASGGTVPTSSLAAPRTSATGTAVAMRTARSGRMPCGVKRASPTSCTWARWRVSVAHHGGSTPSRTLTCLSAGSDEDPEPPRQVRPRPSRAPPPRACH